MHSSNKPQHPDDVRVGRSPEDADAVECLWAGVSGRTVRCVPTRRTVHRPGPGGGWFGKWRHGARRDAAAEWRWLHVLPLLGIPTPAPVAWLARRGRSLLVTRAVAGRGLDAWFVDACHEGFQTELFDYLAQWVAPMVRRLHDHGLVHRDLYWNHFLVADPRAGTPPVLLDVERVKAVRWFRQRWVVKDLAGLWSSVPVGLSVPRRAVLRFLREYFRGSLRPHCRLLAAAERKALRIRRHVPRYG